MSLIILALKWVSDILMEVGGIEFLKVIPSPEN